MDRNVPINVYNKVNLKSLSARRAWIEIKDPAKAKKGYLVALRKESVDRNLGITLCNLPIVLSLSARRAWIEIDGAGGVTIAATVALRKESVDRNLKLQKRAQCEPRVALRKESVDRNFFARVGVGNANLSLSARRAWIEI